MNRRRRALCALLAAVCVPVVAGEGPVLRAASDLRRDAEGDRVVLVLFSLPGCRYCEAVRSQHLAPLQRDAKLRGRLVLVEVDIASDAALRDFSGAPVTHRRFAASHGVKIAPTVMALGISGRPLGKPIVGAKIPEFYGYYLDGLLEAALGPQGLR